ncbi:MAG: cation:proton antiporter [Spirochaetes bacterium]|nr:cation:proton antiporter [Spirochaetota bacterium]
MPSSFELALYSLLAITAAGAVGIPLARATRIHPAFFFIIAGALLTFFAPFTFTAQSLLVQLAEVGALFVIFLSAIDLEWDIHFAWQTRTIAAGFFLQFVTITFVALAAHWFFAADLVAALTVGTIASLYAPDRKASPISDTFRNTRVASEASFMGFISEIVGLVVVAIILAANLRTDTSIDILQLAVGSLIVLLVLVSLMPQALSFLLRHVGEESYALYYTLLTLLIAVVLLVRRAGVEPLLGTYAAGFVFARFATTGSKLIERLRFTGHSIIVPAFYLQFGIAADFSGAALLHSLLFALLLLVVSITVRFIALRILRATNAHAAMNLAQILRKNPLALVFIYFAMARGLVPVSSVQAICLYLFLNEIFVSVLTTQRRTSENTVEQEPRLLLPVSNPETMLPLLTLAGHLGSPTQSAKIFPLNIVPDDEKSEERIRAIEEQFNEILPLYVSSENRIELTTRIADDRIDTVAHTARELLADRILLGLGVIPTLARPQGYSFLESLSEASPSSTIIAAHLQQSLALTTHVNIFVASASLLPSINTWLPLLLNLAARLKANPVFFADTTVLPELTQQLQTFNMHRKFGLKAGNIHAGLDLLTLDSDAATLSIAVIERTTDYPDEKIHARLPEMMLRAYGDRNFILLYPGGKRAPQTRPKRKSGWRNFRRFFGF